MTNLRHVGLIVRDSTKALKLYSEILGFQPKIDQVESGKFFEQLTGINDAKARTIKCFSSLDNSCIEIIEFLTPVSNSRKKDLAYEGFNHIALNVKDLEAIHTKLKKIEIEFISEPSINLEKTAKVCFCKDFEGNLLELVETIT